MSWVPDPEFERALSLRVARLSDEFATELQRRRSEIVEEAAARGIDSRSGYVEGEITQAIAAGLAQRLRSASEAAIELIQDAFGEIDDERQTWLRAWFESYADLAGQSLKQASSNERASGDRGHIDQVVISAKADLEMVLSRVALQRRRAGRPAVVLTRVPTLAELQSRDVLKQRVEELLATGICCAVVYVDLDNFKTVNDRFGHARGDQVLEDVAHALANVAVHRGQLYRYGQGDEFVLVLPNSTMSEAEATAERSRAAVEEAGVVAEDLRVTASVGVAASNSDLHACDDLLSAADKAMYASKYLDKNRVTAWPLAPEFAEQLEAARREARGRAQM